MLSTTQQPAGLMYLVESVDVWIHDHAGVEMTIEKYPIPGGSVAGFATPGGHAFYVFRPTGGVTALVALG